MTSGRLRASVIAVALMFGAGCTGDHQAATTFAPDAELVSIYKLQPPDGFDPYTMIDDLADQFDLGPHTYDDHLDESRAYLVADTKSHDDKRYIEINLQDQTWKYQPELYQTDNKCASCAPVTISHDAALERAQSIWTESGTADDDMDYEVSDAELPNGDYQTVRVDAWRTLDGQRIGSSSDFRATFGNGDELLSVSGSIGRPTEVGKAELIPVEQAITNELGANTPDIGADKLGQAEIVWGVEFDRSDSSLWIVPLYRIPISDELETLTIETPAADPTTVVYNDAQPEG